MDYKSDPPTEPGGKTLEVAVGNVLLGIDEDAERSYVRKLDYYLLPFLSLCYFFSAVDRVREVLLTLTHVGANIKTE